MEFNRTNYEKMLDELFARHPSVQKDGFTAGAYKPGLGGMMEFDARLGSPWRNFKTIHVAGTNGKGSVCSMLAAALAANGYKVGLYTSPYIFRFHERMQVDGQCISDEELAEITEFSYRSQNIPQFESYTFGVDRMDGSYVQYSLKNVPETLSGLLSIDADSGEITLSDNNLSPGVYYVTVTAENIKGSMDASFRLAIVKHPYRILI